MGRAASALRVGEVVAQTYCVESLLGEGGMGAVFAVRHTSSGRRFALKLLTRAHAVAAARFVREGQAAAVLGGRRIPTLHDQGRHDGVQFLVFDLLRGEDLERRLRRDGPLPVARAVRCIMEACAALATAHAHGYVHRDIKPANLFLADRANGVTEVVLLDFGVVKDTKADKLTATDSVVGSPQFISPEQLLASRDVDPRADIWSLGATLFELLAGVPAFPGRTVPDLCTAILRHPPRALGAYLDDAPNGLEDAVQDCLRKAPDERPADVGALARRLAPFAGGGADILVREVDMGLQRDATLQLEAIQPMPPSAAARNADGAPGPHVGAEDRPVSPEEKGTVDPEGLAATVVREASSAPSPDAKPVPSAGGFAPQLAETLTLEELAATRQLEAGEPATFALSRGIGAARLASLPSSSFAPSTAPAASPGSGFLPLAPPRERARKEAQRARQRRRRQRRRLTGVAFLLLLALTALVGWWFGRNHASTMGRDDGASARTTRLS
ncbi:MAG: serine/threonine-protein kinase [Myxococcota bacterium]